MAIIATLAARRLSTYRTENPRASIWGNQPRTQIIDSNAGTHFRTEHDCRKLVITPVIYANQTAVSLGDTAVSITWKRKEAAAARRAGKRARR